jgi:hypothetical protein
MWLKELFAVCGAACIVSSAFLLSFTLGWFVLGSFFCATAIGLQRIENIKSGGTRK